MILIISLLSCIHKGTAFAKTISLLGMALMVSPLTWLLDKLSIWHLENETYVTFVVGAIVVDHLLGSAYHAFWKRDFSLKLNVTGLILKLFIVVSVGYLFEGLNMLMAHESVLKDYTVMVLRLMVFLYPAGSAFGNSYEMTGRKFPPVGFMDKLKQFSESATLNNKK